MSNTTNTSFVAALQEYIDLNGTGQGMRYLSGVLDSLQLHKYDQELLQTFTDGLIRSVNDKRRFADCQQLVIDA